MLTKINIVNNNNKNNVDKINIVNKNNKNNVDKEQHC